MRTHAIPGAQRTRWATTSVVCLTVLLAGCGVRLETPDPAPLLPDAVEVVRQDAAEYAMAIAEVAARVAALAQTSDEVGAVLDLVADACESHLAALGGVYEAFPTATATATATASTSTPSDDAAASVAEGGSLERVVALLRVGGDRAFAAADRVPDGPMARLLASVGTSRLLLADALATAAGDAVEPAAAPVVPERVPDGVTVADLLVLIQSEDAAGLAWEVAAARSAEPDRGSAAVRATAHRDRAQAWAEAADVAGSGTDPRRTSYDLPDALSDPSALPAQMHASLAEIEGRLAASYASLVAVAEPGARMHLRDALTDCVRTQVTLGVQPVPLPGMPGST